MKLRGNRSCAQINTEGNYKDGKPEGKSIMWYENGQIIFELTDKEGICVSEDC